MRYGKGEIKQAKQIVGAWPCKEEYYPSQSADDGQVRVGTVMERIDRARHVEEAEQDQEQRRKGGEAGGNPKNARSCSGRNRPGRASAKFATMPSHTRRPNHTANLFMVFPSSDLFDKLEA